MEQTGIDQETIDALLDEETETAPLADSAIISKKSADFVNEVVNCFVNTLLNLTQKNVDTKKESQEVTTSEKIAESLSDKIIVAQTAFSKDIEAQFAFVYDMKTASTISDLVLMGEGIPKEELTEDDRDALKETMNQVCGLTVQQITDIFDKKTTCEPVNLVSLNASDQKDELKKLFDAESMYAFTFSIKIEELLSSRFSFYIASSIDEYLPDKKDPGIKKSVPEENKPDSEVMKAEEKVERFGESAVQQMSIEEEGAELRNVELIKGIEVNVKIKLGETTMPLKKVAKLSPGTIIELNKDVDSYLELIVNERPIAEGVLVVVSSNNFALRITNILTKVERVKRLGGVEE